MGRVIPSPSAWSRDVIKHGHCRFPGALDVELLHAECKLVMNAGDGGLVGLDDSLDAHFTDVARRLSRQGAQVIANPSLFGPPIAELPYTQIVFRAVENRTAVVMADVAYNSAVVDPYGRILQLAITPGVPGLWPPLSVLLWPGSLARCPAH